MHEIANANSTFGLNTEAIKQLSIIYNDLGLVYFNKKKNYEKALHCLDESIKYFDNLIKLLSANNSDENKDIINSIKIRLNNTKKLRLDCLNNLGNQNFDSQNYFEALKYYNLLQYVKKEENLYIKIAKCLINQEEYISAATYLNDVNLMNPENYEADLLLGNIFQKNLKLPEKAIEKYEKCHANKNLQQKLRMYTYIKISSAYNDIHPYSTLDKQLNYLKNAEKIAPDNADVLRNLAICYKKLQNFDTSIKYYQKLLIISKDKRDFINYGCMLIKLNRFKEGTESLEKRFDVKDFAYNKKALWNGKPIKNKTLLVQWEQGYNDTLCFARYLNQLEALAKKIIFRVQDDLYDLIKQNFPNIIVIKDSEENNDLNFDYFIPLLSLLDVLDANDENIPSKEGYINADKEKVEKYNQEYFNNKSFNIGISWNALGYKNNPKNIPLEVFYPLASLDNTQIYLFGDVDNEEQNEFIKNNNFIDLAKTFKEFSDIPAAIENLDLFITCDNVFLHVAGAMGKKTYLMLNKDSEWRWGLEEKQNIWYNSVENFKKQDELESWDIIMDDIIQKIQK